MVVKFSASVNFYDRKRLFFVFVFPGESSFCDSWQLAQFTVTNLRKVLKRVISVFKQKKTR